MTVVQRGKGGGAIGHMFERRNLDALLIPTSRRHFLWAARVPDLRAPSQIPVTHSPVAVSFQGFFFFPLRCTVLYVPTVP
jgi:hypothetical protein